MDYYAFDPCPKGALLAITANFFKDSHKSVLHYLAGCFRVIGHSATYIIHCISILLIQLILRAPITSKTARYQVQFTPKVQRVWMICA
jgi:hypothetical protein